MIDEQNEISCPASDRKMGLGECLKRSFGRVSGKEIVWCPRFSVFPVSNTLKDGHRTRLFKQALRERANMAALKIVVKMPKRGWAGSSLLGLARLSSPSLAFSGRTTKLDHARPHPCPLPQGEGETSSVFGQMARHRFKARSFRRSKFWGQNSKSGQDDSPGIVRFGAAKGAAGSLLLALARISSLTLAWRWGAGKCQTSETNIQHPKWGEHQFIYAA